MASLKRQLRQLHRPTQTGFPWSKDHGLIEARGRVGRAKRFAAFPWSKDHGLIEAIIAANQSSRVNTFPWSKDHGLIEAPSSPGIVPDGQTISMVERSWPH